MKKITILMLLVTVFVVQISTNISYAHSQDSLEAVVMDGLYGGLAGALVGAATTAFSDKPSDHTANIQIGAGIGVILGTIYGTVKVAHSVAKWEDGKMTVQFPAIQFDVDTSTLKTVPFWKLDILHIAY